MSAGDLANQDLSLRLGTEERDDLEFKANGDDRNLLRKAICSLANDLPGKGGGHVLVGVDKQGRPAGITVDDALLLTVVNIRDKGKMRVGPSTRRAHREEELRLAERRRAADLPFDQRPVLGATITDLDLRAVPVDLPDRRRQRGCARRERPTEQHLSSCASSSPTTTCLPSPTPRSRASYLPGDSCACGCC